jgi:UDP-N-acetylmuramoylalanine--D-glutamate ligase
VPHITHGFFIGQAQKRYADWLSAWNVPVTLCDSLEEAVACAHTMATQSVEHTEQLKTILLSPGCASFDQFQDFEHRGRVFKQAVMAHAENTPQENA